MATRKKKILYVSGSSLKKGGLALTSTRSEFDSNQISALPKKRQKYKPHALTKGVSCTFISLGRALKIANDRICCGVMGLGDFQNSSRQNLCNLIQPQRQPCFEQDIGPGNPRGPFLPNFFLIQMKGYSSSQLEHIRPGFSKDK